MELTWRFPEVFFPLFIQKQSFYRDMLRTNVGKTQKRPVLSQARAGIRRAGRRWWSLRKWLPC